MFMFELSKLIDEIIKIRDLAIEISAKYYITISKHDALAEEVKKSFEESRKNWTLYTRSYKTMMGRRSAEMLTQIDKLVKALEASERNLYEYDKSYANRKELLETLDVSVTSKNIFNEDDDYLEKVKKTVVAMQKLTNECSLSKKAYPLQELEMLFSKKRGEMYETLHMYVCIAHKLREEAYLLIPEAVKELWEKSVVECDTQIDEAAMETAQLLQDIAYKKEEDINYLIEYFEAQIDDRFISILISEMQYLIDNEGIAVSDKFNKKISLGILTLDFQGHILHSEVQRILEKKLGQLFHSDKIFLPMTVEMSKGLNLFAYENQIETTGKCANLFNKLMILLLLNAPASMQRFVLFDPAGRGKGFVKFLELFNKMPELNGGQVWTTKEQMAQQLRNLSNFVDEVGQNKLAKYDNIYEYNDVTVENQEPLKCLTILNFPKYFDERMLDDLYNVITNGMQYGINVFLHYDGTQIDKNSDKMISFIENLKSSTITVQCGTEVNFLNDEIMFTLHDKLAILENDDFISKFTSEIIRVKKQGLDFNKISEKILFSKSCTEYLSIPIGKSWDGDIQDLRLGENSSHHCIIAGATGSGKSTLLHTIIMSALCNYNPDELNLYLMDFKSGTEFKVYSNYSLPHIKLLALDAMQDFGESILTELLQEMNRRSILFKEKNSKDIQNYRECTGYTLPRLLVLIDEFQILFDEANNRKVATNCGNILSTLVMQGRSYGIHLILSTQTLRMADRRLSIQQSTLDQMLVRIGLKCSEREADYLFGSNGAEAFRKMYEGLGAAVYSHNYVEYAGKQFKVAFCDMKTKNDFLKEISEQAKKFSCEKTRIFEGNANPSIEDINFFTVENEIGSTIKIHLGEPIKVAPPIVIEIDKRKRNNLLVVGTNEEMTDRIVGFYLLSVLIQYSKLPVSSSENPVYYMDGNYIMNTTLCDFILALNERFGNNISIFKSNRETITAIDELYDIFTFRKKNQRDDQTVITVVINNLQWLDGLKTAFVGGNVNQFTDYNSNESSLKHNDALFGFLENTSMSGNGKVNHKGKLREMLESGYTYGINFVITSNDYLTIREYLSDVLARIQKRIVHSINASDVDKLISGVTVEGLNSNVAIYTDGVRETCQFKPYAQPRLDWIKEL